MEGAKKSLQVSIENCEFAREFHYFLTVQLDGEGEKVRARVWDDGCRGGRTYRRR